MEDGEQTIGCRLQFLRRVSVQTWRGSNTCGGSKGMERFTGEEEDCVRDQRLYSEPVKLSKGWGDVLPGLSLAAVSCTYYSLSRALLRRPNRMPLQWFRREGMEAWTRVSVTELEREGRDREICLWWLKMRTMLFSLWHSSGSS